MLIDTSGLLCLHYPTEPLHSLACSAYKKATVRVTHSYIIAEYVALANARRFPRSSILAFVVDLLDLSGNMVETFRRNVSTRVSNHAHLITGDVYWITQILKRFGLMNHCTEKQLSY
ncbi:hypothetical protein [Anabaena sphaerica]|uniref:hypothetical protein n=1 Tax=Anabaena sphaerica TaxID=212446 RepID=UPI001F55389E|nr:hypothetical protein [Anabaena sphaerica]